MKTNSRNHFMLKGPLSKKGYDWWWHNFTATNKETKEERSFFIEYYICNPSLAEDQPVLGQLPHHLANHKQPAYAMIKCGVWGHGAKQIHGFYPIKSFQFDPNEWRVTIGHCELSEKSLKGSCSLSPEDAINHPEYMSDSGSMTWDLTIDKQIPYSVGYGASSLLRRLNAFEMFWHVQGMKTQYQGTVTLDGVTYDITKDKSYGYADKNWGSDFTSPWLWLASWDLKSTLTGKALSHSAFVFGGGKPKVFGIPLSRKLLGTLVYEGQNFEYNFSKFWTQSRIDFDFTENDHTVTWRLSARNRSSRMEMTINCSKEDMLWINYESPKGEKRHNKLWNGGTGTGTLSLYQITKDKEVLLDNLAIGHVGCEYGEYENP